MGLFSSIGGLFDSKPSKQFRKAKAETERALYGTFGEGPPDGPFTMSAGSYSSPFAEGFYGPGGSGYSLTQPIQNLFDQGLAQAGTTNQLYNQYITPDFFTSGPLFDMLNESRIGRVQRGEDAAANALSQLFNTSGMNTASMMDMSKVNADLAAAKAQEDANVLFNLQRFQQGLQGARGRDMNYLAGFDAFGNQAVSNARALSGDLTNLELAKLSKYLDANNAFRAAKAQEPGLGATLGGLADAAVGFYAGGMGGGAGGTGFGFGQALQSQFNPNFAMEQFFDRLTSTTGTTGNTGIGGLTPAEQEYLRTGGYLRA